uniref:lipid II:glycine glycyltransferase FemX n=1 Tax=Vaginimicrobium propionicum TaxID=1871034 RepID=UPI000970E73D|nr:peptidoglycan bridge formation glycyltransferase FemA/FemB family protein [Vaginimicrobium propionicum]
MFFQKIDEAEFNRIVEQHNVDLPIEQSTVWLKFDEAMGRTPWLGIKYAPNGDNRALMSLASYQVRGFKYLWARHGPVWIGGQPSATEEEEFFNRLAKEMRDIDSQVVFIRAHAMNRLPNLEPILQTITYDQTVIIDLTRSEDDVFAAMRQSGRRNIRKGLRNDDLTVAEWTNRGEDGFHICYKILQTTADRDGFGIYPESVYLKMMNALGSKHCRLFVAELKGEAVAWALVTVYHGHGVYYYGGSTAEAHKTWAADLLHWRIMQTLQAEGVKSYDLMGIGSELSPQLGGVTQFKRKFAPEPTRVAPAWDLPVKPGVYRFLQVALKLKHQVSKLIRT